MKVLFVSSGNSVYGVSPITKNQGNSLAQCGISVTYFPLTGKGLVSYIKNSILLRKHLAINHYDLIHAHYSLTALVATLSGASPLIVSLMGSDSKASQGIKMIVRLFYKHRWRKTIVKSDSMRKDLGIKDALIIPNGVDMESFIPMDKGVCQKNIGWSENTIHLLFAGNPERTEKNFSLTKNAVSRISGYKLELHWLDYIPYEQVPVWLNASDVVILSSLWEGSPNIIKESMACNRPVVTTYVGDIRWLFGQEPGHFLAGNDPVDIADKINQAIFFSNEKKVTNGRKRIFELGLDSNSVANRIIEVYKSVLKYN